MIILYLVFPCITKSKTETKQSKKQRKKPDTIFHWKYFFLLTQQMPKDNQLKNEIHLKTYSFFWRLRNVKESPQPVKASSFITVILLFLKSKWRKRCKGLRASLGIACILLSPKRKYCRFSGNERNKKFETFSLGYCNRNLLGP